MRFDDEAADIDTVRRMIDTVSHRGPDGIGTFAKGAVALGHSRLAIIDLSQSGAQPMSNESGTVWVSFNGEIYNFKELRSGLIARGHRFKSETDTEVLLHAYEEWGHDFLHRLNGMFAFGLWDCRNQSLWLVRDRLGIKPAFYAVTSNFFAFGSEAKVVLEAGVERHLDLEALGCYLQLNYTPAPMTLIRSVRQVLPGHHLVVRSDGSITDTEYWHPETAHRAAGGTVVDWEAGLLDLLDDSVRLRLNSDRPVGSFLSGGIDSSAVALMMSRHAPGPIRTFSAGFQQASFSELPFARKVASALGTEHSEVEIESGATADLERLVWHAEEPTADSSMTAVYQLARLSSQSVAVVLTGDGADEQLAGYETYQAYYARKVYRLAVPRPLRGLLSALLQSLSTGNRKAEMASRLGRFVRYADLSEEDAHASWRSVFDPALRNELLAPLGCELSSIGEATAVYRRAFERAADLHPLNRMLCVDLSVYLPNDMLVKVDRMTMAHGLEARVPFLDHRLVEFLGATPTAKKMALLMRRKHILKRALRHQLPNSVLSRKKEGFNVPNALWLRNDLRSFAYDTLAAPAIRSMGVLDTRVVERILEEHMTAVRDRSHELWCLLVLATWWRLFMK